MATESPLLGGGQAAPAADIAPASQLSSAFVALDLHGLAAAEPPQSGSPRGR